MTSTPPTGLQASAVAMVAHGLPTTPGRVTPPTGVVNPPIKSSSAAINLAETVANIAKEASEVLTNVPYVGVVAGVLLHIIEIREEIQIEKGQSRELIDKILRRSRGILSGLLKLARSPNRERLKDTEKQMEEYNLLLQQILSALNTRVPKGKRAKLGAKIDQYINRKSRIETLAKYDRLINEFNADFVNVLLIDLVNPLQPIPAPSGPASVFYKPIPYPDEMIGRDEEKSKVIETLLNHALPRVAILGAGGMGKTTLALATLHDPVVIERYPSRYFVSCEAVTSLFGLVSEIANSLHIPPAERNESLADTVLSRLHKGGILYLDNFETIWEDEAIRWDVEGLLSRLDRVPGCAIVMTMRGTQRPSRVSWSKPLLPPLEQLRDVDSKLIFDKSGALADEFTEKLLHAANGIPLAIKLVIARLQEGNEQPKSLWARWQRTQTNAIGTGRMHRLSNLDVSIHLSVHSPRMRTDPSAILVFCMLSSLPDGFPCRQEAIDELQTHMPRTIRLQEILVTLQQVSLVHIDGAEGQSRYRMLVPIREFGTKLEMGYPLDDCLVAFYADMMSCHADYAIPASHGIIPPELLNIHSVLTMALNKDTVDEKIVIASIIFTYWSSYIGNHTEEIIDLAKRKAVGKPGLHAQCISALADVYVRQDKLDEAESSFTKTIELHRQSHDVLGEADDVQKLGELYLRQDRLDEAESSFTKAIELHRQSHTVLGEANDVQLLGQVYLRRDKLDEAESSFTKAIELHRQLHAVLSEANDVHGLGKVYLRRDKLNEAESSFMKAIELHRQSHTVFGEANDVQMLGEVYVRQDKLEEAESSFTKAIELHRQSHVVIGEADDVQKLGDVYLRQNRLDEAESSFMKAIKLHRQSRTVLGEANDVQKLGELYWRRDKLDEAESSFTKAIELHRQSHAVINEANDVYGLGQVYLQQDKLDEAESSFTKAIELHRQSHAVFGEANDVQMLGEVYLRRDKLDEAESSFTKAIELHRQSHTVLGEANDVQLLGQVYLRRDKLDEAESSFTKAIELHHQLHAVLGEANDTQLLGEVYLRQDKLDKAESSFMKAIELYCQSQSVLGEANGVGKLGEVYLRRDRLGDAEQYLTRALLLHHQCQSPQNEAVDLHFLERVRKDREVSKPLA